MVAAILCKGRSGNTCRWVDDDPDFLLLEVGLHELGPARVVRSVEERNELSERVGHVDEGSSVETECQHLSMRATRQP